MIMLIFHSVQAFFAPHKQISICIIFIIVHVHVVQFVGAKVSHNNYIIITTIDQSALCPLAELETESLLVLETRAQ